MTIRLHYFPGACSFATHILLRELGVSHELVKVELLQGEQNQPAFLALNPKGQVPVLSVDGQTVTETAAILTWLSQRHAEQGFYPSAGTIAAARCAEWLAWLSATVHTQFAMIRRPLRFSDQESGYAAIEAKGRLAISASFQSIEQRLSHSTYACGESYSVADMYLLVFYRWGNRLEFSMRDHYPVFTKHAEKIASRPAVAEAIATEGIQIWST